VVSQTNELTLEAAIEKFLTGTCREESNDNKKRAQQEKGTDLF